MGAELPPTEVLLADQRRRWSRGERVPVEHLVAERPHLNDQSETLLDLIYGEVVLRREAGERPDVAEYVARFPKLADPIRLQFEVDQALDATPTRAGHDLRSGSTDPDGGPAGPPPPAPPGYEILSELGRGGMGIVFLARQIGLDRVVALKMIRSGELADPGERARFEAEARAASRLSHPNVVQVYEVGEHAGRPYLALEYVPGGTLADALNGPPMAARTAAALTGTLARAVEHAHAQGVVHRDLKPANILLTGGDVGRPHRGDTTAVEAAGVTPPPHHLATPKIADFGLAKRLGTDGLTQTGDFVGTPSYAAPEQAAGRDVGPAADVWALGAILYQMLTGRAPFVGDNAVEILDQVRFADPLPPSRLRPNLPRDLGTVCLKCLRKDPGHRYPSAAALADDLERFRNGEPVRARPVGVIEQSAKWCRRRPALAGTLAGFLALAAGSLIVVTVLWQRAVRARDAEGLAHHEEANARADERIQRERAEARGAELLLANARYAWLMDDPAGARKSLAECPPAYRTAEWAYLDRALSAARVTIPPPGIEGHYTRLLVYDPSGQTLAGIGTDHQVRFWDPATGTERQSVGLQFTTVLDAAFIADGRLAVAVGRTTNASPGKVQTSIELVVVDPRSGATDTRWRRPGPVFRCVLSRDAGRAVVVGVDFATVTVLDALSGTELFPRRVVTEAVRTVALSADGTRLVLGAGSSDMEVWDAGTGGRLARLPPPGESSGSDLLATSADVGRLAVCPRRARPTEVIVRGWSGDPIRITTRLPQISAVALSADGRRVAAHSSSQTAIPVWDAESGQELLVLRGPGVLPYSMTFSPDGRSLAIGYVDGRVVVWTVDPDGPGER